MVHLDYRDSRPIYAQIVDGFREQITGGVLRPGEKLPSVRDLAAQLAINPNTIQRAYRRLEAEGWIATVPGKGCFVCGDGEIREREKKRLLLSFDEAAAALLTMGAESRRGGRGAGATASWWPESRRETIDMLEMKNVTKTFGNFKALDDLTLTVPSGRVYGLVGPNGAGKSTAIRHLTGVYRPDSGSVTMDEQPIYENPAVKATIGYIPDEIFYYPSATLEDMRKFYRGIYPTFDDALFDKLYDVFQLPKRTPIRRFSKGMQKQAAFHLTVCTRPKTLILDEPVDGLDPVMRRQVMGLILSDVAGHGTTVLISSHNLRELEDVCDYVGIMNRGKMLLEKSLADMQGSTVKLQLVGDAPQELDILNASVSGRLKTLIVRGEAEEVGAKMAACKPAYFDVLPLSLEEIFIYELGGVDYEIKDILL